MIGILLVISLIAFVIMSIVTANAEDGERRPWMHLLTVGLGGVSILLLIANLVGMLKG